MRRQYSTKTIAKCYKTIAILCFLMVPGAAMALDDIESPCADAELLPLNTSLRSYRDLGGESHFFKLEVPEAGLVTLDVAVPGPALGEAKIGLFHRDCGRTNPLPSEFAMIERTPTRLALFAKVPGTYLFAVAAQSSQSILSQYRVTAGFVTADVLGRITIGKLGEDDNELDLEPDADPDPPPGLWFLDDDLQVAMQKLCQQLKIDDHGDTFACATLLGPQPKETGTILNSWGDDQDFFLFMLTETHTIQIATTGPTDTFGTLYDRHGHRLAMGDSGGSGDNFRIVKTLSPGYYFVRVEGSRAAEGPYTILVQSQAW